MTQLRKSDSQRLRYYLLNRSSVPYEPTIMYSGYDFDVPEVLREANNGYSARTVAPWQIDKANRMAYVLSDYDLQPDPPKRHWWQRPKRQRSRR